MSRREPKLRPAEREAYCRSCDEVISKGTNMISWYSWRNQGMNIHLCLDCVRELKLLLPEGRDQDVQDILETLLKRHFMDTELEWIWIDGDTLKDVDEDLYERIRSKFPEIIDSKRED